MSVPVLKYSSSDTLRSKMSSTPTRSLLMISQAETVASMVDSSTLFLLAGSTRFRKNFPPKRSIARRISGWKMTTSEMKPSSRILFKIQLQA